MSLFYKFAVLATVAVAVLIAVAAPLEYPPPQTTEIVVKYPFIVFVGTTFTGDAAVFVRKTGACGIPFDVTKDMVVAMNQIQMGKSEECGKTIGIRYKSRKALSSTVPLVHWNSLRLSLQECHHSRMAVRIKATQNSSLSLSMCVTANPRRSSPFYVPGPWSEKNQSCG